MIELYVINKTTAYQPATVDGITLESERRGSPGALKFTCIEDEELKIEEGNAVKLIVDEEKMFFGFIFAIKRTNDKKMHVTAYDQLRYLKNKDSYLLQNKTAQQVVSMIAKDFSLQTGTLSDTKYVIGSMIEDNKTLFDIINDVLDETLKNTKKLYVLYDEFGKIALKNTEEMLLDIIIDEETGQGYDYTSSINENVYNQIKLTYDNKNTGKREVYISKDSSNIAKWGVLQYYEAIQNPQGAAARADALLKLYNAKTRNLKITGAFGDTRVRAGCSIIVQLTLPDVTIQHYMLVEKVKHTISKDLHTMDLTLRGGGFSA